MSPLPILYSLRQCPYAMRARMGLLLAKQPVILRDVDMKNKPTDMLTASPKATVPVLVIDQSSVIDQSLDIMLWALSKNDPNQLLHGDQVAMLELIHHTDNEFVEVLKKYKAASRYHDVEKDSYRLHCEAYINDLEQRLTQHQYIMDDSPSLADYAILPFIRQFSRVERQWYRQAPYPSTQRWLNKHYQQTVFTQAMAPCEPWNKGDAAILFGSS